MAITNVSGTQTASIGTEHTLADTAAIATYILQVDTTNMVAGDVMVLRIKMTTLSGDSAPGPVAYSMTFVDAQPADDIIKLFPPVSTPYAGSGAIRATLQQAAGTGRNFKWSLLKFA